jgi:hypothetical protein
MKNNNLVITASNWSSFVASLRSNLKLGYGICTRTSYRNSYFSAVLQQGTDRAYIARLSSVTGEEKENVIDLVSYLGGCEKLSVSDETITIPGNSTKEVRPALIECPTKNPQKTGVDTTIKRVRKSRSKGDKI